MNTFTQREKETAEMLVAVAKPEVAKYAEPQDREAALAAVLELALDIVEPWRAKEEVK
jgi:hypothetical protein